MARKQLGAAPSGLTDKATKKYASDAVAPLAYARGAAYMSTTAATATIDCTATEIAIWNGLTVNVTGITVSGASDGQTLTFRVADNGDPRTFTAGTDFINSGVANGLTTTIPGKVHTVVYKYNAARGKWVCMTSDLIGYPWDTFWRDDFDGPTGSLPDPTHWTYDVGDPTNATQPNALPWPYNSEDQVYTNSTDNVRLDGLGNLIIECKRDAAGNITSSRLKTEGRHAMMYGTLEASIKWESGAGILPAFWMLGTDEDTNIWPDCGEIDVAEFPGNTSSLYRTIHGPNTAYDRITQPDLHHYQLQDKPTPAVDYGTGFNTFWVARDPNAVTFGVNSGVIKTYAITDITGSQQWVFNKPMYALLNIAAGGSPGWPAVGTLPTSGTFSTKMTVEYVQWKPKTAGG